jgi:hypothetical protein
VLANPGSLFQVWQLPLVLVFIVAWLWGGGVLFRRTLSRLPDSKRVTLGRGILVSFLAGLAGGIAAGAVLVVCRVALKMSIGSVIIAAPVFPVMAYLVVFAMFNYSPAQTLRASLVPIVAIMLTAGLIGAACGIPAITTRRAYIQEQKLKQITAARLAHIFNIMSLKPETPPKTLQELLDMPGIDPTRLQTLQTWLKSPANPKRQIGVSRRSK